jgi:hypothetical protein
MRERSQSDGRGERRRGVAGREGGAVRKGDDRICAGWPRPVDDVLERDGEAERDRDRDSRRKRREHAACDPADDGGSEPEQRQAQGEARERDEELVHCSQNAWARRA